MNSARKMGSKHITFDDQLKRFDFSKISPQGAGPRFEVRKLGHQNLDQKMTKNWEKIRKCLDQPTQNFQTFKNDMR